MEITLNNKKIKGVTASVLVMFSQGWEGMIIMTFALLSAFVGIIATPSFAAASLFAKEIFTFVLTILVFGNKKIIEVFKKGFTSSGLRYGLGFVVGSSIGSTFYIMAIGLAGPGYGTILTATYPVFTTLLLRVIFKEKSNNLTLIGVTITILSGLLFLALPTVIGGDEFSIDRIIGIAFGAITSLCWSVEGIMIHSEHRKKRDVHFNDKELAIWKTSISLLFISIIVLPISMFWGNSYEIIGDIFNSWKAIVIIIALAVNLILTRVFYTYSIRNAGVRLTSIIDTNNFVVSPLIIAIFSSILVQTFANDSSQLIYEPIIWWAWLLLIPIVIGAVLVITSSHKNEDILDHEK